MKYQKIQFSRRGSKKIPEHSPDLVTDEIMEPLLDHFRYKMLISGYSDKEREIIIREGISRYKNILALAAKALFMA